MKIIVDGIATEYMEEGHGPTLLMLHGWGDTSRTFDALVKELSDFRVVRVDLPGFGASEISVEPWDVAAYVRFVAAFCGKLRLEPKALVGHSFGGRVIIKGMGAGLLSAEKIVLISSAGVANRRTARNALYAVVAKLGKSVLAPLPDDIYQHFRRVLYKKTGSDYLETGAMSDTFVKVIREDLSADAARVTIPTLIIWGENDNVTLLEEASKLHNLIKDSKLITILGADHFVHQEKSGEVGKLIREFCV